MNTEGTVALNNRLQHMDKVPALSWSEFKSGPDHEPVWTSICKIDGVEVGRGTGPHKNVAKDAAARQALQTLDAARESAA